jgi:hypothetical protein
MNTNLLNIVKQITAEYGEAVLADPARLKAFFSDLAKDEPKPLRIAFGRCIEAGAYAALKGAPDAAERAEHKAAIARRVFDEHGIAASLCAEALDILEAALFTARKEPPRCAKCGAELREEWKLCPYCGAASGGVPWAAPVKQPLPHMSPQPIVSPEAQTAILPRKKNKALPVVLAAAAVFVVGSIFLFLFLFLWSNPASGSEIFSSGSDVYAAGYIGEEEDRKPVYWKNGQIVTLSNKEGEARSIFVSGPDAYAAGEENRVTVHRLIMIRSIIWLCNKDGEGRLFMPE